MILKQLGKIAVLVAVFMCTMPMTTSCQTTGEKNTEKTAQTKLQAGSKVYIAPMDGFETYLKTAIQKKRVPIEIVEQREKADYEITGVAESKKAGAAKIVIMGSWHSTEDASIKISNLKTGEIVYAYSVHKENSTHGKQSSAEACAKHLKDEGVTSK